MNTFLLTNKLYVTYEREQLLHSEVTPSCGPKLYDNHRQHHQSGPGLRLELVINHVTGEPAKNPGIVLCVLGW